MSGGANATEGRVEICSGGSWGTVCDDFWGTTDAQVVCNQLGFANQGLYPQIKLFTCHQLLCYCIGAIAIYSFSGGTGSIYLDNVHCSGNELRLIDCPHNGIGTHNCVHSEDAGVRCMRQCTLFKLVCIITSCTDSLKMQSL